jgi:hypothetical protein
LTIAITGVMAIRIVLTAHADVLAGAEYVRSVEQARGASLFWRLGVAGTVIGPAAAEAACERRNTLVVILGVCPFSASTTK